MPNIIEITDFSAPGLDVFVRLTEAQLRSRLEAEKGVFIAESPKVIERALDAGCAPVSLLTARKHIAGQARGVIERGLGLFAHPRLEAFVGDVLIAGRVDQRQVHVADVAVGIAPVAGHAGPIIDQREAFADETIEQCRFAHIGAADDGDLQSHVGLLT